MRNSQWNPFKSAISVNWTCYVSHYLNTTEKLWKRIQWYNVERERIFMWRVGGVKERIINPLYSLSLSQSSLMLSFYSTLDPLWICCCFIILKWERKWEKSLFENFTLFMQSNFKWCCWGLSDGLYNERVRALDDYFNFWSDRWMFLFICWKIV